MDDLLEEYCCEICDKKITEEEHIGYDGLCEECDAEKSLAQKNKEYNKNLYR